MMFLYHFWICSDLLLFSNDFFWKSGLRDSSIAWLLSQAWDTAKTQCTFVVTGHEPYQFRSNNFFYLQPISNTTPIFLTMVIKLAMVT